MSLKIEFSPQLDFPVPLLNLWNIYQTMNLSKIKISIYILQFYSLLTNFLILFYVQYELCEFIESSRLSHGTLYNGILFLKIDIIRMNGWLRADCEVFKWIIDISIWLRQYAKRTSTTYPFYDRRREILLYSVYVFFSIKCTIKLWRQIW